MNIHDKGRKLVEQEAAKLKKEFKPLEDILRQDDKALEKLDQLIHKAEKDAQNAVAEEIKVNPTEGDKMNIPDKGRELVGQEAATRTGRTTMHSSSTQDTGNPEILRVFQSKAETKAFYDKISHVYDLLAEHSEGPVRRAGLEKLEARSGEKVLEIGFGTGHCLVSLAQSVGPTGKVYGLDLSERMLEVARDILHKAGLADRVELTCGDAVQLPYQPGLIDAIFMSFTLELFDTPEIPKVLAECKRVLRPGGRVVVVGVSKEGENGLILRAFEWTHRHFPNLVDCRPIFVRQSLEDAGFRIESADRKMMWVPVEVVLGVRPGRSAD